ncbi:MAG TPA: carboxypeptidase-like regulatory domain-containing protein [Polyangia bacterium]|jgi:hypothetical protein
MKPSFALLGIFGLAATAPVACGGAQPTSALCRRDDQCGGGAACVAGTCLPHAAPPATWNVELVPKTDSAAGFTEILGVSGAADAFDLAATAKIAVTGTLSFDDSAAPLKAAHVVFKTPAMIAGRPDIQYETDLLPPVPAKMTAPTFTLSVPANLAGRTASLQLLPTPPDDLTHPPSTFAVTVAAALPLSVSSKTFTVQGRLLSALGDPVGGLVARAFQNSALVSNVVKTTAGMMNGSDGTFALTVPTDRVADAQTIAIELEPVTPDSPLPHYWAKAFTLTANDDLGDIHLPAFSQPNAFRFVFHGETNNGPAVVDAVVRARTILADDMVGTTDFERDGLTDGSGQASLSLLPGSTAALLLYDIGVVPPANAPYAATCLEMFPLAAGGLQPTVVLERRPIFSGTVVGDDGAPVSGVVVLATRTAGPKVTACDDDVSTPQVTAPTATDGTFSLDLDAGTYTFDFDPPAGSPYPRLTQVGLSVPSSGAATQTIRLPAAAVVDGTVRDAAGQALPLAGVRFYGPACVAPMTCAGRPPVLEAETRADANGHYRAVIPFAAASPP